MLRFPLELPYMAFPHVVEALVLIARLTHAATDVIIVEMIHTLRTNRNKLQFRLVAVDKIC